MMDKVSWLEKNTGIKSVKDFQNGTKVCTNTGTTTELNMADFFKAAGVSYEPVVFVKDR